MARLNLLHHDCGVGLTPEEEELAHTMAAEMLEGDPFLGNHLGRIFNGEGSSSTATDIDLHAVAVAKEGLRALG